MPLLRASGASRLTDAEMLGFLEERLTAVRGKIADLSEIARFIEAKMEAYRAAMDAGHVRMFCPAPSETTDQKLAPGN